jgi:hypothetical protein
MRVVRALMKVIALGAVITLLASVCSAQVDEEGTTAKIRYGMVRVVRSYEGGPPDELRFMGRKVFLSDGNYIAIHAYFKADGFDAVLFGVNCGGSSCPPDQLYFLILRPDSSPTILTDSQLWSADGKIVPMKERGRVLIDLGFDGGRSKMVEVVGDKLIYHYSSKPRIAMAEEDCEWLFEGSEEGCALHARLASGCENADEDSLSLRVRNRLNGLSNHPGYVQSQWRESCVNWCRGKQVKYDDFRRRVCSIGEP